MKLDTTYWFTVLVTLTLLGSVCGGQAASKEAPNQSQEERTGVVTSQSSVVTPAVAHGMEEDVLSSEEVVNDIGNKDLSGNPLVEEDAVSFLRTRFHEEISQRTTGSKSIRTTAAGGDACADQPSCESCVAHSAWCHWCDNVNECHSKGSFYGCFSGAQCDAHKNHTVDPDDVHGCASHETCGECAMASRFCHWCGHDQTCHVIGSVYGCTVGVDCFSNDRCKRKTPEKIKHNISFQQLQPLPVAIVTAVAVLVCCCASVCFCICSGVKGAYDDLVVSTNLEGGGSPPSNDALVEPLLNPRVNDPVDENPSNPPVSESPHDDDSNLEESSPVSDEGAAEQEEGQVMEEGQQLIEMEQEDDEEGEDALDESEFYDPMMLDQTMVPLSVDDESTNLANSTSRHRRSIRPRPPRHMQRMYNVCTGCYLVTMLSMFALVMCSAIYFPQVPVYNICNDDVAWKSIIDSMASMHTKADFEILASLSNPNHISVALDNGTGFFHHNGKFAGSFTIPPFTAEAMSITDILIIAHLTPGTWDAVQIAKEYSMGKLILHVNTSVVIRVPALADFTYEGKMDDIVVNVNEINDRSLCACPSWNEAKNHSFYETISLEQEDNDIRDVPLSLDLPLL